MTLIEVMTEAVRRVHPSLPAEIVAPLVVGMADAATGHHFGETTVVPGHEEDAIKFWMKSFQKLDRPMGDHTDEEFKQMESWMQFQRRN